MSDVCMCQCEKGWNLPSRLHRGISTSLFLFACVSVYVRICVHVRGTGFRCVYACARVCVCVCACVCVSGNQEAPDAGSRILTRIDGDARWHAYAISCKLTVLDAGGTQLMDSLLFPLPNPQRRR